ncbi:MAG: fatty acid desaturase, partial [Leptolyngbya sp. SIO1D8]|nr:fatty acid desaturase [Leptolyngbya sp. SIO1D8]
MSPLTDRTPLSSFVSCRKLLWDAAAIAYTLLGYVAGLALLLQSAVWANAFGVLLLTHSLVYSAYLSHEFMHSSIFPGRRWNVIWRTVMLWLNGGCYGNFDDLSRRHIAHHVDRVDFAGFDIVETLRALPKSIRWAILS